MNKKLIRLTEGDLHKIVKESVDKIIKEGIEDDMLKHNAQNAIIALSVVASRLEQESNNHVYGGDSNMIHNGGEHLDYYQIYDLCTKTIKALQKL